MAKRRKNWDKSKGSVNRHHGHLWGRKKKLRLGGVGTSAGGTGRRNGRRHLHGRGGSSNTKERVKKEDLKERKISEPPKQRPKKKKKDPVRPRQGKRDAATKRAVSGGPIQGG